MAQFSPDIGHQAVTRLDMQRASGGSEDQRGEVAGSQVAFDGLTEREVGEDVPVVGDERFIPHEGLHIFYASASVQEDGFVPVFERQSAVAVAGEKAVIRLRAMVGVDGE